MNTGSSRMGIRSRVLVVALLPLLLMTLLMSGYFIKTRLDDSEINLRERGHAMARLLGSAAEFGLMTGDSRQLAGLGKGPILEADVLDIIFLDARFQTLQRFAEFPLSLLHTGQSNYKDGHHWYFIQPVQTEGVNYLDSPEGRTGAPVEETIGWVVVVMTDRNLLAHQQEMILQTAGLFGVGFMLTLLLALRFGRRISKPILHMAGVVASLRQGHYKARVDDIRGPELKVLAQGINQLASQVQESRHTLEKRVDEATRQLNTALKHLEQQNASLSRAQQQAAQANRAKDQFLARMSHELRTPLTSVLGFARLMQQSELDAEQQNYIRIINQTSSLLLAIIDDILDFTKLESDAIQLERIQFNLEHCVQEVLEMQAPQAFGKGVELFCRMVPGTPVELYGDPTRLRQILVNLIGNAIKFTNTGSVELTVQRVFNYANQVQLQFTVRDTGIGIPEAQLRNLFQAFSQADTSISRRFGGSGLGLVISRRLTELMGGHIELNSEEGKGTEVQLSIPFRCHAETSKILAPEPQVGQSYVLVYDPNPRLAQALKERIQASGRPVQQALSWGAMKQMIGDASQLIIGLAPDRAVQDSQHDLDEILPLLGQRPTYLLLPGSLSLAAIPDHVVSLSKPLAGADLDQALDGIPMMRREQQKLPAPEHSRHILLAEDNDFNRELVVRILHKAGLRVTAVSNGQALLAELEQSTPDLVLVDVHMPGMTGIEASQHIHRLLPQLPILALTANVDTHDHQALLEAGVSQVLLKPIDDRQLLRQIRRVLKLQDNEHTPPKGDMRSQLSREALFEALLAQEQGMDQALKAGNFNKMRHHSHQLLGLAGLYEMPELEAAVGALNQALNESDNDKALDKRTIWQGFWRLQRLLAQTDTLDDDSQKLR